MDPTRSQPFRQALRRAVELLFGRGRLAPLMRVASQRLGEDHGALRSLAGDVAALIRLVRHSLAGRYRNVSIGSLVTVVAALVYFINPLDIIPDLLPAFGYADDAVVFLWVLRQMRKELDTFLVWEQDWGEVIEVEASRVSGPAELPDGGGEPSPSS